MAGNGGNADAGRNGVNPGIGGGDGGIGGDGLAVSSTTPSPEARAEPAAVAAASRTGAMAAPVD
ncbi:hypothetical protein [Mycobacterium angelicum]|uniref:Uncharacterized protein n=1 Tax=Mycobacterium angelicum TaxID=470074 RepID=A0A1W9ZLS7_MYCAN|nr:hypothetical protein [Mycobacterium angelicum]MCV7196016.1 hypothetical protein [Mycobacterium angelicum]ORA18408.1 hypothetical protein BST12_18750 [Mycobacterium angelicum]